MHFIKKQEKESHMGLSTYILSRSNSFSRALMIWNSLLLSLFKLIKQSKSRCLINTKLNRQRRSIRQKKYLLRMLPNVPIFWTIYLFSIKLQYFLIVYMSWENYSLCHGVAIIHLGVIFSIYLMRITYTCIDDLSHPLMGW